MKTLTIPAVILLFFAAVFMIYPPFGGSGKINSSPRANMKMSTPVDTPGYAVMEVRMNKKTEALKEVNKQNMLYSKAISRSVDSLQSSLKTQPVLTASPEELEMLDTLPIRTVRVVLR